jgi:hypothetical protein
VIAQPPPASPAAPPAPARVQTRNKVKAKPVRSRNSKPARAKRALPAPSAAKVTDSSAPDSTLVIGGLALVVLVLGDTIFLAFSARLLRLS